MDVSKFFTELLPTLVNIGAMLSTFFLFYKAVRTFPKESLSADLKNKKEEASVAESMEQLAEKAAQKVLKQQEQIDALSAEVSVLKGLRHEVEVLKCELDNYVTENKALRLWAEALVGQLEEAHLTPAPMPEIKRKRCPDRPSS